MISIIAIEVDESKGALPFFAKYAVVVDHVSGAIGAADFFGTDLKMLVFLCVKCYHEYHSSI